MDTIYERRFSAVENRITATDKHLQRIDARIEIVARSSSSTVRQINDLKRGTEEIVGRINALQRQADHIDDQALPSITCDLDVLQGRATAVEHTAVTMLIRMNDIVDLHDAICSHCVGLVDEIDEPAPIIDEIDERIDELEDRIEAAKGEISTLMECKQLATIEDRRKIVGE